MENNKSNKSNNEPGTGVHKYYKESIHTSRRNGAINDLIGMMNKV